MNLRNKKVVIIGAGKSGQAAARLLDEQKALITILDNEIPKVLPSTFIQWCTAQNIPLIFGEHQKDIIEENDLIIISPGVRQDALVIKWAQQKDIPIWGEIELASRFCKCPIIAITGTNGKTTVVTLITDILKAAGKSVKLCGNVGYPFSDYVLDSNILDYIILEISSFQLESICQFKPYIAVFLNFSQNHLDRHKDMQEYFEMKCKIFQNQTKNDYAILNSENKYISVLPEKIQAQVVFYNSGKRKKEMINHFNIGNPNFYAAATVAEILKIPLQMCIDVWKSFKGVEHRLEFVRTFNGVDYINDSKATTTESGRWALLNTSQPVIMICGGRDKNINFSTIKKIVQEKVKKMIVFGEAKEKLQKCFESDITIQQCQSLDQAVLCAREAAHKGDCVLFSPMCASFDMFLNFEDRGRQYKDIVKKLS